MTEFSCKVSSEPEDSQDGENSAPSYGLFFIAVFFLLFSVARGIRFPSAWSATHYLFDYSQGFVKRGFFGSLLQFVGIPNRYSFITSTSIAFCILLVLLVLLLKVAWEFCKHPNVLYRYATLLFFAGPAMIFLAHEVGYFDHIGLILALIAIRIRSTRAKYAFIALGFAIAILIHEALFVIFYPVVFISVLMDFFAKRRSTGQSHHGMLVALMLLSVSLLAGVYVVGHARLNSKQVFSMYTELQAKADFELRANSFEVMTRDANDNLEFVEFFWKRKGRKTIFVLAAVVVLPAVCFLVWATSWTFAATSFPLWLLPLSLVACCSPLILHFLGIDNLRWNILVVVNLFLLLVVLSNYERVVQRLKPYVQYFFLICLLMSSGIEMELFDQYGVKSFPFSAHVAYLKACRRQGAFIVSYPDETKYDGWERTGEYFELKDKGLSETEVLYELRRRWNFERFFGLPNRREL